MLKRVISLIIKELLAVLRDPKSRIVLIVPPIIQIFVFSFAATQEAKNLTLAVLNQDGGRAGVEVVQRFENAGTFTRVITLQGRNEINATLDEQKAIAVLVVPQDFSRSILSGDQAHVQFILDGRKTNASQIVRGYASRIIEQYSLEIAASQGRSLPAVLIVRDWFNENLTFMWYTVPSLVCIIATLIGLLLTSLSVSREREMGTFEQLLVSPLGPLEILLGKAIPALFLAMIEASILLIVAMFIFRIPMQGSLPVLYGAMAVFLLSLIGVGLFISSLSLTQQQAILGTFIFMTPAMLLSGFSTPIENMPHWLQTVTLANPLRWFLVIVRGVFLKDMPFADVVSNTWPLLIIAAATLTAAAWLFRHRME